MTRFVPVEELFKGRHFDREIVVLCVRWYLSFKLSYRDLVTMMLERGIELAHTTILRWVQHYTPEFEKRWNRYARSVGLWCKFRFGPYLGSDLPRSIESYPGYAASAACQIAAIVAVRPPSLPNLYCPFLIFSISSIPLITTAAVRKFFSPSMGRSRCLTRR